MIVPLSSVIIVTAPSGTGKTTLTRRLVKENPSLSFSISITTRPIRKGETDGVHYWYVDEKRFMEHEKNHDLVEWARVFGNLYGTSKAEIERIHKQGRRALLEIDVQGAKKIRKDYADACAIFIMPPSIEILWNRLKLRGTDSLEVRWRRLKTAQEEILAGKNFEHFIINDDLERAYGELQNLVIKGRPVTLTHEEGLKHCQSLIDELQKHPWNSDTIPASMRT